MSHHPLALGHNIFHMLSSASVSDSIRFHIKASISFLRLLTGRTAQQQPIMHCTTPAHKANSTSYPVFHHSGCPTNLLKSSTDCSVHSAHKDYFASASRATTQQLVQCTHDSTGFLNRLLLPRSEEGASISGDLIYIRGRECKGH